MIVNRLTNDEDHEEILVAGNCFQVKRGKIFIFKPLALLDVALRFTSGVYMEMLQVSNRVLKHMN